MLYTGCAKIKKNPIRAPEVEPSAPPRTPSQVTCNSRVGAVTVYRVAPILVKTFRNCRQGMASFVFLPVNKVSPSLAPVLVETITDDRNYTEN